MNQEEKTLLTDSKKIIGTENSPKKLQRKQKKN
jgi:hypothetical protein